MNQLFEFHFMVNAFRAGTITSIAAACVGWFMVTRRQSFAGHTMAVSAFPGAAGAVWLGISATFGYFAFAVASALAIALLPGRSDRGQLAPSTPSRAQESAVIGTVQVLALALGLLFVSLYKGFLNSTTSLLFGSFLGITDTQVVVLLAVSAATLVALGLISKPLLFASIDPDVAGARGLPVRSLSVAFLVLLGLVTAEVSQITGALLVFALLVMPAAAAQRLSPRPAVSLMLAIVIAVVVTWAGMTAAYFSVYPVGFYVTTFAFGIYTLSITGRHLHARVGVRR